MAQQSGNKAIIFIFITVLIDSIGFGIILPVMPTLIMHLTGADLSSASRYAGWLYFTYAIVQFFCAPVLGNLSDRYGRRPVILSCLLAFGLDYIVMGMSRTIGWLFVGRIVAGISGASFTPSYAYIADISPPERRAQNFGLIGAAFGFGFIAGPAIGGLLGGLGPRAPFFAAAALALSNFVFGCFALPESLPQESRRPFRWARANPAGTFGQLRRHPEVLGLISVVFLWQVAHQVLPSTWSFYTMFKFGWSQAAVGASLAFAGVVMALGQGVLTRHMIPALGGERRAALAGMLGGAATYIGYAFSTQGWMVYCWMLAWFLAAMVYPALNALMSRQIAASAQGELQGGVASMYSLSAIAGPPLMTQLFSYFSSAGAPVRFPGAPFLAAAILVGCGMGIFLWTTRPHTETAPAPTV